MIKILPSFQVMNNKDLLTLILSFFRDKPKKICVVCKKICVWDKEVRSYLDLEETLGNTIDSAYCNDCLELLVLTKFNCGIY